MKNTFNLNYSYCLFTTRAFIYTCFYKTVVKKLSRISKSFPNDASSLYLDDFCNMFFSDDELSSSKKVEKYLFKIKSKDAKSSLKKCLKAKYSVFCLDNKILLDVKNDNSLFSLFKSKVIESLDNLIKNMSIIDSLVDKDAKGLDTFKNNFELFNDIEQTIKIDKTEETFLTYFSKFRKIFNTIKEKTVYLNDNNQQTLEKLNTFREINKLFSDVSNYVDFCSGFKTKDRILAFVSSLGTINICLLKESFRSVELSNEIYDSGSNNDLIIKAVDQSEQICSIINRFPKCFSFLDLNKALGFKHSAPIYDIVSSKKENEKTNITNKTNAYKTMFLKMLCNDDSVGKDNPTPMIFYDYLSLLISYQHRFDQYSLWQYLNMEPNFYDEMNKYITDYARKTTEHLYYDDSFALLSVIDQETNSKRLSSYDPNLVSVLPKASHQVRIYSFWKYLYACSSITFGSSSLLLNNLMAEHIKNVVNKTLFKPFLNHKLINLAYICSKFDSLANHTTFNAKKDSQTIVDGIFNEIGLVRIEDYLKHSSEINWKSGELINTQTYHRYGLIFSVASLLITLVSFGMIAYIRIDCEKDGKNVGELLNRIFSYELSPKVLLIFLIILVPIIIWLLKNIYDSCYICIYTRNLPKLCRFTRRIGKNKKTK